MHDYEPIGKLDDLVNALTQKKLKAWGFRNEVKNELAAMPSGEWADLYISPPKVKRSHPKLGQIEPWTGLRFESSDLKKLWRGTLEIEGRTHYKWKVLKKMYHEIDKRLPDVSQNEKILELQEEYETQYNSYPSRSSIQEHIKRW